MIVNIPVDILFDMKIVLTSVSCVITHSVLGSFTGSILLCIGSLHKFAKQLVLIQKCNTSHVT